MSTAKPNPDMGMGDAKISLPSYVGTASFRGSIIYVTGATAYASWLKYVGRVQILGVMDAQQKSNGPCFLAFLQDMADFARENPHKTLEFLS